MCIFPAIAVYVSLLRHGVKKESAVQLISEVFTNLSGTGYKFVSLWLSLFGNYHRYPAAFVKSSLRYYNVFGDTNLLAELLKRDLIVQEEYNDFIHLIYESRQGIMPLHFEIYRQ